MNINLPTVEGQRFLTSHDNQTNIYVSSSKLLINKNGFVQRCYHPETDLRIQKLRVKDSLKPAAPKLKITAELVEYARTGDIKLKWDPEYEEGDKFENVQIPFNVVEKINKIVKEMELVEAIAINNNIGDSDSEDLPDSLQIILSAKPLIKLPSELFDQLTPFF